MLFIRDSSIVQELLVPEVINLSYDDYFIAINDKEIFENLGIPMILCLLY